jgi:hypothetical protein
MLSNPNKTDPRSVLLRLPKGLHDRLKAVAAEQGVSVNTYLVGITAGGVGWRGDETSLGDGAGAIQRREVAPT